MSTPKLVNFPHFLDSRSWERNMSTPKLVNFPQFLDSRSWERNISTPKLVNFPHFLDSRSWERNMSTPKLVNFPIFGFQGLRKNMYININVHMYITWFCYIWRVAVLSFSPPTPKLVNSAHFLESWSWEKTCQHQKWSIYHIFWIPGVEKNMYIYIYI